MQSLPDALWPYPKGSSRGLSLESPSIALQLPSSETVRDVPVTGPAPNAFKGVLLLDEASNLGHTALNRQSSMPTRSAVTGIAAGQRIIGLWTSSTTA